MGDWRGTERVYTLAKEQADPQQAQKNKKLVPSSSNYLGPIGGTTSEERPIQIQNVLWQLELVFGEIHNQ